MANGFIWGFIACLSLLYVGMFWRMMREVTIHPPIRFNRQRREVCYFPSGSDEPIIQPWEELVAWVSVSTGTTGEGIMSTYTLGMALDNPKTDKTHFLNQGVLTPAHGLSKWEAIRVYMEKGPTFCPGKAPYEGRHTFDEKRESMREAYREGDCSAFGVAFWYVRNVITWWRFPYWVAEWDHRYSMKPMPASISRSTCRRMALRVNPGARHHQPWVCMSCAAATKRRSTSSKSSSLRCRPKISRPVPTQLKARPCQRK